MLKPDIALTYFDFVEERHRIWERRQRGESAPWTEDPILRGQKFTNVFRALDHGSQFLIKELLTPDLSPRDALARCFLYRYTNLPTTWMHVRQCWGEYPKESDLGRGLEKVIQDYRDDLDRKVFSGAYVILPQPNRPGDKVEQAVQLAARWMKNHAKDFLAARTQQDRFHILRREYGVGDFMAMQILTDWGYSPQCGEDRENSFVVPGPGCRKGAKFINPSAYPRGMIDWAHYSVLSLPDCPTWEGRPPSLMDIQNTFCEFSKYWRTHLKGKPVKGKYPSHHTPEPPTMPEHF